MNVKELRDKLVGMNDNTRVTVYWEDGNEAHYFEIDTVSEDRGTPKRLDNGKAGFEFNRKSGEGTRVVLSVSPA